ncbi:co-chaperone YbbN [Zafaria sp. Z1313]|uniref:co-chaperone YbbN n=1 Tax=Zafaria sp. Z1313 TaxID=3423202 RepID=UPI003D3035AC
MSTTPEPAAASSRGAVDLSAFAGQPSAPGGAPGGGWTRAVGQADFQDVVQLSSEVPVVVSIGSSASPASGELDALLGRIVDGYGGRLVLATVDASREAAIVQAFRVQQVPAVVALVKGQPVPMFQGALPEAQLRELFDELLQLGAQHGATGTVPPFGAPAEEAPLPPAHQEALDKIDAGDYAGAAAAYHKALAEKPNDAEAATGLANVELLERTSGMDASAVRAAGAEAPGDVDAQLAVADLDLVGGHVEDAFNRLLSAVGRTAGEERDRVRARLVEHFGIVGAQDPRVGAARQKLARLLF